mmetsp:Transcript_17231/g.54834  ORF Transcript_17231/g.54834 Transcript_17231/m.54834 type:complete len:149 (-) Transcript_17231:591-1037(-)
MGENGNLQLTEWAKTLSKLDHMVLFQCIWSKKLSQCRNQAVGAHSLLEAPSCQIQPALQMKSRTCCTFCAVQFRAFCEQGIGIKLKPKAMCPTAKSLIWNLGTVYARYSMTCSACRTVSRFIACQRVFPGDVNLALSKWIAGWRKNCN